MMRAGPTEGARPVYDDRDLCPVACRQLFAAVVREALHQVESGVEAGRYGRSEANAARLRDEARAWFRTAQFEVICDLADLDPDRVRAQLRRIEAGEATVARRRVRICKRKRAA